MPYSFKEHLRRRRSEAAAQHLCVRCCKNRPSANRRTCGSCNEAAKSRVARMRERKKEQRRRARAALEHAAAAHAALQRSAYDEVIFEYQQAAAKADSIDDKAGYYFHTGIAYTY